MSNQPRDAMLTAILSRKLDNRELRRATSASVTSTGPIYLYAQKSARLNASRRRNAKVSSFTNANSQCENAYFTTNGAVQPCPALPNINARTPIVNAVQLLSYLVRKAPPGRVF